MAFSITFHQLPRSETGHQRQYQVTAFNRPGLFPVRKHFTTAQMSEVKMGRRGWFPVGLDTATPGWATEWSPDKTANPVP